MIKEFELNFNYNKGCIPQLSVILTTVIYLCYGLFFSFGHGILLQTENLMKIITCQIKNECCGARSSVFLKRNPALYCVQIIELK